jgi:hypothetical protein
VTIRSLVGLVDLGGAFARQQHRQGLVDELGIGGASAHPSGVIEQAAIHGGSPHVAGAPQMSACRSFGETAPDALFGVQDGHFEDGELGMFPPSSSRRVRGQ